MRITASSLVLPILAGLAAFSSKRRFPDYELTQFFSWALFLVCAYIFCRSFKHRPFAVLLVVCMFVIRSVILLSDVPPLVQGVYFVGGFVIVIMASFAVMLKAPETLLRQMYWLSAISVVVSLLQIHGVMWMQEFGSALADKGLSAGRVWFQGYDVVAEESASTVQARPDGFTHANNLTSQLLLMFYAYCFFYYTVRTGLPRASGFGLFLIAFASALNAGKVIVLGIAAIWAVSMVLGRVHKGHALKAVLITAAAYLLYSFLSPGLFILNFNPDMFAYNASGRIINFGVMAKTDTFVPLAEFVRNFSTDKYIPADFIAAQNYALEELGETYSGLGAMAPYLPVLLPTLLVIAFVWSTEVHRLRSLYIYNLRTGALIMAVALAASILGGAFYRTVWFTFFLSLTIAPLLWRFYDRHFLDSVACSDSASIQGETA